MVFKSCWNHHFMPKVCGLEFDLKNEIAKLDKVALHGEFQKYTSNESEASGSSSHMAFGSCVSCQRGGNELAYEIPFLPSLEN